MFYTYFTTKCARDTATHVAYRQKFISISTMVFAPKQGRRQGTAKDEFVPYEETTRGFDGEDVIKKGFKCKHCPWRTFMKALSETRAAEHLTQKCQKVPPGVKARVLSESLSKVVGSNGVAPRGTTRSVETAGGTGTGGTETGRTDTSDAADVTGVSGARTRGDAFTAIGAEDVPELKRPKVEGVAQYLDYCTPMRAARINLAITKFIVGNAIPFNVVSSVFFVQMLHELNTAFVPHLLSSATFRRSLLPELYRDVKAKVGRRQMRALRCRSAGASQQQERWQ